MQDQEIMKLLKINLDQGMLTTRISKNMELGIIRVEEDSLLEKQPRELRQVQ